MIPTYVTHYLQHHLVPFSRHLHPRAVSAQRLAEVLHVSGHRIGKSVILEADGERWMAVLPASELVDEERLAEVLKASRIALVPESAFDELFPQCECGAEPPFGRLYGLPVVTDIRLAREERVILRAGSHEETLELAFADYARLEKPFIADIGRLQGGIEATQAW